MSQRLLGRRRQHYDRSIDIHVSNLRQKVERASEGAVRVETVRGIGCRIGQCEPIRRGLRNALRFSPRPGAIRIALHRDRHAIMVVIVDEGPGVPPERMSTLFDPFVRGADGGWGLGLAIARRAIGAHGGTIAARVAAPTGLAVTVTLPLATTPAD